MTRGGPFPARRRVLAAELTAGAALLAANAPAAASPSGRSEHQERGAIPSGYLDVDPRTAVRVPLTMSLRDGVPLYPGDPPFSFDPAFQDSRTLQHDDGGYLLERITSLGTHTASHISAPVHFIIGGKRLDQLDEDFTLMPLAVLDVRARILSTGPQFTVGAADLRSWERRHASLRAAVYYS